MKHFTARFPATACIKQRIEAPAPALLSAARDAERY
jgi:hypothetical protein